MNKLLALVDVLRKGSAVSEPDLWKNRAGAVSAVAGLIAALVQLARLYGYDLPIDSDGILALAGGLVTVVSLFLAYGTSKATGVLPAKPAAAPDRSPGGDGLPSGPEAP